MNGQSLHAAFGDGEAVGIDRAGWAVPLRAPGARQWPSWLAQRTRALGPRRWTLLVYLASRLALLAIAVATAEVQHLSLFSELGRWDGTWYTRIASSGYPTHPSHLPTTLGFFPLYPLAIWLVVHAPGPPNSVVLAGLLVSGAGGLVATVLIQRLVAGWWGEPAARRATVMFCFFPGSIVFSMDYGEGLLIPLAAACILALQRRRWLLAGALAGVSTAIQPDALALAVACAVGALLELRRNRWHVRRAGRSLLAPILSVTGIGAFAVFLWVWTGTPFATLEAQHYAWGQRVDPLALPHQGQFFVHEVSQVNLSHLTLNLGPLSGILGAVVLIVGVVLLARAPRRISPEALAFTLTIGVLAVVSETLAPNPRILITAFPAILVYAYRCRGAGFRWLMAANGVLLVVMSALTYGGHSLSP